MTGQPCSDDGWRLGAAASQTGTRTTMFEWAGLVERIGAEQIFLEVDDTIQHYSARGDGAATGDKS